MVEFDGAGLLAAMQGALADAGAADAELYVHHARRAVARFANNDLHQHVDLDEVRAIARVSIAESGGARVATVSTTQHNREALATAIRDARVMAACLPVTEGWPGPARAEPDAPRIDRHASITARAGAAERVDRLAPIFDRAIRSGVRTAGLLETGTHAYAVANTRGLGRFAPVTFAAFKIFVHGADDAAGFAQGADVDLSRLDLDASAAQAFSSCDAGRDPVSLDAGSYDVLLEPAAVCELLQWLSFTAFGAEEFRDGTSAFAGRIGAVVASPDVTIQDGYEGVASSGFGPPFDREGVTRTTVPLIDRGTVAGVVYDRLTAARAQRSSTGHAVPPGDFRKGPTAQAVCWLPGTLDAEQLLHRLGRGLAISRFHYVNGFLDPPTARMTGLTRDGTFLVEGGERTRAVRNLRFTDSILEALGRVDGVGRQLAASPVWWSQSGAFLAPAIILRGLRFSSGSVSPR